MGSESYDDRAARFRHDLAAAMISDSDGRIAKLAEKYNLEPEYVATVISHTYLKVAVQTMMQKVDCKPEHIEEVFGHVCTIIEGAQEQTQFERGTSMTCLAKKTAMADEARGGQVSTR